MYPHPPPPYTFYLASWWLKLAFENEKKSRLRQYDCIFFTSGEYPQPTLPIRYRVHSDNMIVSSSRQGNTLNLRSQSDTEYTPTI
ncbi:hypothetical protein RRG08_042274 [Elysia crispata]|uniref:Uncharacterized protein n=1 Tax=Elysia crispata TaxID=231223 RepID=A0AAE1AIQ7_9GAST|nr:hypothetical protein RRG08_042274 [Elysia crispata]